MADTKITSLTADGSPTADDLLITVNAPGTTPGNRKVTVQALLDFIEANFDTPAGFIDALTEIDASLKTGSDLTLVTGTEGTNGTFSSWNADGDLVGSGKAVPTGDVVGTNDNQTLSNKSINGSANTIDLDLGDITFSGSVLEFNTALQDETFAMLGTSNTFTGVNDFGGATSLEIPNGAAPTVNAAGEIAVDTTITDFTGLITYYDGTEQLYAVALPTAQLTSPTDGDAVVYNAAANEFQLSSAVGAGDAWGDTVDADIIPTGADSTYDLGSTSDRFAQIFGDEIYATEGIIITEAADHPITPAAGIGQIWVSNDATQKLNFTDDGGTDREILTSTSGASLSTATILTTDSVFFSDASDSDNSKVTTVSNFITDLSLATITGAQTLTNKTLTSPKISHAITTDADNYTLDADDQSAIIRMTGGSANQLTIPTNASVAFPLGTKIEVWSEGAGTTTIAGDTGVTLQGNGGAASAGSCDIQTQYGGATLTKVATNTWNVAGDIDAVS